MKKFRPGVSFSDFVIRDSMVKRVRGADEEKTLDFRRGWLIWIGVLVVFGLLTVRLAYLQVFYGQRYRLLSDQNRIKKIVLPAPRGKITDRNGQEMVGNLKTAEVKDGELQERWERVYRLGSEMSHFTGYLGEVGEKEVGLLKELGRKYRPGDLVGRGGLEMIYEKQLRGVDGGRLVEVDSAGKIVREMGRQEPVEGKELKLGIDAAIQRVAYEAMGTKKGAVVASDPRTGEIRVLVSTPGFDPNLFSQKNQPAQEQAAKMLVDTDLPLFNRAISGVYPPGSTFKMVTTAAAISENKVNPGFTYQDTGMIKIGSYAYTNWLFNKRGGVEGWVGFGKAITRSTDTFFYRVGEMTGPETIGKWAKLLGLGEKTGIDLPGEAEGLIPSPEWKKEKTGERWFLGNTFHMAIGQGDVLATPLQINVMTNVISGGGRKCQPHFLSGLPSRCTEVKLDSAAEEVIKQGMIGACSPGGTAYPLFDWNEAAKDGLSHSAFAKATDGQSLPVIACKTGTAEYMGDGGKMKTHGWLTAFAPAENPEISVTVLVEGGGEGSDVAAPVVRKVLAKYFGVEDTYNYSTILRGLGE